MQNIFATIALFFASDSFTIENPQRLTLPKETSMIVWEQAQASAYTAGDGYTPGVTMANGEVVHVGAIACPRRIALGTRIELQDIGVFTCKDRMAARYQNTFDIYKDNIADVRAFGRRDVEYRVINEE